MFKKVDEGCVKLVFKHFCEETETEEEVYLSPAGHVEIGIPVCQVCDDEYEYSHTEVEMD